MNPEDPLLALVAAENPVPTPDALSLEQQAAGERLRQSIATGPTRRAQTHRTRNVLFVCAGAVPALVVLIVVLSVHGSRAPMVASLQEKVGAAPRSVVTLPTAGSAETVLVIGSDHRAGEPYEAANTDTMLLVRLAAKASTVKLLSVPRDLLVDIPHAGHVKLNAAYSIGGPALLTHILTTEVFPGLQVNHIIDVNFGGFSAIVNALGCVDSDVDHRYYNNTAQTDYSSIDIQPGYQPLCGNQALQFVRFRHTDTDLVRTARQRAFFGWLRGEYPASDLIAQRDQLLRLLGEHAQTDPGLHSVDALLDLFDLIVASAGDPIQDISFPATIQPCNDDGACGITATLSAEAEALHRFLEATPDASSPSPRQSAQSPASAPVPTQLSNDPAGSDAQAAALRGAGLPVYLPARLAAGSQYCSSATGNCNTAPNPVRAYVGAYPRAYVIDTGGRRYPSYRITVALNQTVGEYYGIQGTTWQNPPILNHPDATQTVSGRPLLEFFDGDKLTVVAFRTSSGSYWVSNTLTNTISNNQMVAIAASMHVVG